MQRQAIAQCALLGCVLRVCDVGLEPGDA